MGYEPYELDDGTILQSAVYSEDPSALAPDALDMHTMGHIARAVVLRTYYVDDPSWSERGWSTGIRALACDVRLYGRRMRPLFRVPVAQTVSGLFDDDLYVPRGSNQDIEGGPLTSAASSPTDPRPTTAERLDGDHVLVAFLEGDANQPFVLPFSLGHPNKRNAPGGDDGRVRRIRHLGVKVEIDKNANLNLDASAPAKDELGASGTEVENPSGGNVTITAASGRLAKVAADLVELANGASESAALGDSLKATLDLFFGAFEAWAGAVPGVPPPVTGALATAMTAVKAGDYRSSKVKVG